VKVAAVERVWYGTGAIATAARAALWPAELVFRGAVAARNALYDLRALPAGRGALCAISVGNLSVGGTGKTPVAAWIAATLRARGAHPAIVLRGYGGDEAMVHERLNPGIPVIVNADRLGGMSRARAEDADVAVLDDAFQHRRAARVADVVLVTAERGLDRWRLLPAGPMREPLSSLRRASLVVVTRKSASFARANEVLEAALAHSLGQGAIVHLAPGELVAVDGGTTRPLAQLKGQRVLVITAIGQPGALAEQLLAEGAIVEERRFPDHHRFSDAELAQLALEASTGAVALCTLKDAVKIGGRWPGPGPLWYVSQHLTVERGQDALDRVLEEVLAARST
jgi:tetraacyldisaccharide 4'-kinase